FFVQAEDCIRDDLVTGVQTCALPIWFGVADAVTLDGGFACVQCHGVSDTKPLAAFEAPAINFAHVSDRLTKEFYDRWVYNPQREIGRATCRVRVVGMQVQAGLLEKRE